MIPAVLHIEHPINQIKEIITKLATILDLDLHETKFYCTKTLYQIRLPRYNEGKMNCY